TDFPSGGEVLLHVEPPEPVRFALHLRIPPYAEGATARVGEEAAVPAPAGDFYVIEREWRPGDAVRLLLPLPLRCQANEHAVALVRGPLVYAGFQGAQDDAPELAGQRGGYPEDIVLELD